MVNRLETERSLARGFQETQLKGPKTGCAESPDIGLWACVISGGAENIRGQFSNTGS